MILCAIQHAFGCCSGATSSSVAGRMNRWLQAFVRTGTRGSTGLPYGPYGLRSLHSLWPRKIRHIRSRRTCKENLELLRLWYRPGGQRVVGGQQPGWSPNAARSSTTAGLQSGHDARWRKNERRVRIGGRGEVVLDIYTLLRTPPTATWSSSANDVGSNVLTALQLHQPVEACSHGSMDESTQPELVIYLPRGPFPNNATTDDDEFEALLARMIDFRGTSNVHVIKVNYRLAPGEAREPHEDFRFPLAIHDVQCCFDYIRDTEDLSGMNARVSVYGCHFGGGLALMLALTNPNELHAVAAKDPIIDWTSLDELVRSGGDEPELMSFGKPSDPTDGPNHDNSHADRRKGKAGKQNLSKEAVQEAQSNAARNLIDLRTKLFRNPSGFFDPFASPLLFLRAPGKDTPLWRTARPEEEPSLASTNTRAFGPYDDEWQATEHHALEHAPPPQDELNTIAEAMGTDVFRTQQDNADIEPPSPMVSEASSMTSSESGSERSGQLLLEVGTKAVRRRKVLRRWPPNGRSEDVDLPFVGIFATRPRHFTNINDAIESDPDYAAVLHPQAKKMAEVMRRACFWGREKSVGEEKVHFEELEQDHKDNGRAQQDAADWLIQEILKH